MARPVGGAKEILARLVPSYAIVAVVTGRTSDEARRLLDSPGVAVFGQYGLSATTVDAEPLEPLRARLTALLAEAPGATLEDKGTSLAAHYRNARDPAEAERWLGPAVERLAEDFGLKVLPGKMVLELAPADTPGKGSVVVREARRRSLEACLYAGDDRADLDAFAALDRLGSEGLETLKVAVRSEETPSELEDAADIVVERPSGLVALLRRL